VNDSPNVPRLQTLLGKRCGQNDAIVFLDHAGSLLEGMGRDRPVNAKPDWRGASLRYGDANNLAPGYSA
jgi:hypothetical protein